MREFFSAKGVFALRNLAIMSMMAALTVIFARFDIFITQYQRFFTVRYLPGVVVAYLFGPIAALAFGIVSDTVGFFARGGGMYHPGFAISAMVSFFIYACFLYKQKLTILRVVLARLLDVSIVVLGLNFIWLSQIMGMTASSFYVSGRLMSHLAQFPIHVALIYMFCRIAKDVDARSRRHANS